MEFLFFSFLLCSAPSSFEDGNRRERKPHFSTRRQNRRKPSFGRQQHITRISFLLSLRRKRAFIFLPLSSPPLRCASFPEKKSEKPHYLSRHRATPRFFPIPFFFVFLFVCFPLRTPIFHLEGGRRILLLPFPSVPPPSFHFSSSNRKVASGEEEEEEGRISKEGI